MRQLTVEEIGRLDEISGGTEFCGTDQSDMYVNPGLYAAFVGSGYDVCAVNESTFNSLVQAGVWGGAGAMRGGGAAGAAIGAVAGFLGSFNWTLVT